MRRVDFRKTVTPLANSTVELASSLAFIFCFAPLFNFWFWTLRAAAFWSVVGRLSHFMSGWIAQMSYRCGCNFHFDA